MPVAAVPNYLGTDFLAGLARPALGMYLPLWGVDSRSRELLWTTHDVVYRDDRRWKGASADKKSENKTAALRAALQPTKTTRTRWLRLPFVSRRSPRR